MPGVRRDGARSCRDMAEGCMTREKRGAAGEVGRRCTRAGHKASETLLELVEGKAESLAAAMVSEQKQPWSQTMVREAIVNAYLHGVTDIVSAITE